MFDSTIYQTPEYFGYDLLNNRTAMIAEIEYWQSELPYYDTRSTGHPHYVLGDCPTWRIVKVFQDYGLAIYRQDQPNPDYIVVAPPINGQYEVMDGYNLFDARFPDYDSAYNFVMCSGHTDNRIGE